MGEVVDEKWVRYVFAARRTDEVFDHASFSSQITCRQALATPWPANASVLRLIPSHLHVARRLHQPAAFGVFRLSSRSHARLAQALDIHVQRLRSMLHPLPSTLPHPVPMPCLRDSPLVA